MPLSVAEAIKSRISTRAFLDRPVAEGVVREILDIARWAPSGGNLQPWRVRVVAGTARERLVAAVREAIAKDPLGQEGDLRIYPKSLPEPYRTRRFEIGEAMYALLDIPREDKMARLAWLARNYEFFGAPVGLFFSLERMFDKGQWAHLGMFMQSIALVAAEKGLATCMQEAWCVRAKTVSDFLGLGEDEQLYCGMALGYPDPDAAVNALRSERAPVDDFTTFLFD